MDVIGRAGPMEPVRKPDPRLADVGRPPAEGLELPAAPPAPSRRSSNSARAGALNLGSSSASATVPLARFGSRSPVP